MKNKRQGTLGTLFIIFVISSLKCQPGVSVSGNSCRPATYLPDRRLLRYEPCGTGGQETFHWLHLKTLGSKLWSQVWGEGAGLLEVVSRSRFIGNNGIVRSRSKGRYIESRIRCKSGCFRSNTFIWSMCFKGDFQKNYDLTQYFKSHMSHPTEDND